MRKTRAELEQERACQILDHRERLVCSKAKMDRVCVEHALVWTTVNGVRPVWEVSGYRFLHSELHICVSVDPLMLEVIGITVDDMRAVMDDISERMGAITEDGARMRFTVQLKEMPVLCRIKKGERER